jgi:hypothetical protein
MRVNTRRIVLALLILGGAPQAWAGIYKLIRAGEPISVARSPLTVTPAEDWNHLGPRLGRNAESWTMDGLTLDDVTFYGGIGEGATLFKEQNAKDRPLPKFSPTMLPPDIVQMFEESYRIANDTTVFAVDKVEPTKFLGADGVRFSYTFTSKDEVERRGVANAAIIDGKLYMITYEAPVIYYFDKYARSYDSLVASAVIKPGK